jgi:YVTN family beta-propeller protein
MRKGFSSLFFMRAGLYLQPAFIVVALFMFAGGAAHGQSTTANIPAGTHPLAVAVNVATNQIYVANQGSNDVTAIDGKTNIATQVPVGTNPANVAMSAPTAIAVNPTTNKIYVVNQGTAVKQFTDGGVSVIDGTTNTVTATIAVGKEPMALAVNPVTNMIYVANLGVGLSTVTVIAGATNATSTVSVQVAPISVAINTTTNQIFVANRGSNSVSMIDGATNTVTNVTLSPSVTPVAVAVNPVLNHVYVASSFSSSVINPAVSVVDPVAKKVLKTVAVGNGPTGLVANPVTGLIYASNQGDNTVTVIEDGANIGTSVLIPVGNHPYGVALNPTTNQIYVTDQGSNSLTVIDGGTNTVSSTVAVGSQPNGVAVNPLTNTIYVANTGNDVSVIDGSSNIGSVQVAGVQPSGVAINPVTNRLYVANKGNGTVTMIDEGTGVSATIPVGVQPTAIAVNPVSNKVYVANYLSYTVTAIDGATNAPTAIRVGPHPISVGVNPVTNMVYVANQGTALKNFLDSSVSVIDGATNTAKIVPFGADQFIGGSLQLVALAVDPIFNQIYVVNEGTTTGSFADGTLYMLSGTDNVTITQFFPAGTTLPIQPIAVALSPVDGHVFFADHGSGDVNVFDPFGTYLADVTAGTQPSAIAVNPATNQIYVTNFGSHNVTAINGNLDPITGLNLFQTTTINAGSNPSALAVNPVLNKIYVAGTSSNDVTEIDGVSGTATTIPTRAKPVAVAVNPITSKVYVANAGASDVTAITAAPVANPAIPLTTQVQGVSDSGTSNGLDVFATSNASPQFTAVVNSTFTPNTPIPTTLYYQLDTAIGTWKAATATGGAGTNPANYSVALSTVPPGLHTLYLYPVYGEEGTPASASNGTGNSPELGSVQAFPFAIVNPPTNTTITSSANPANAGDPVTFTACATPFAATGSVLGTMSYFDGNALMGQKIIDPNDPNGPNPCPPFTKYGLAKGTHTITAIYSGSTALTTSKASLTENIELNLGLSIALPTPINGQTPPINYGQTVRIAGRVPLAGAVTFSVNGTAQSPVNVVGGSAFLTLTRPAAGPYTIEASFAGTGGQNLTAVPLSFTVNQVPLTVDPNPTFKFYGAANPALTGTVIGVVPGDGITATYSAPEVTTTTPVGDYPINIQLNDPNNKLSNYAVTLNQANLSVFTAQLTLIASGEVRPYGATDHFTGTIVGAIAADKAGFVVSGTTTVAQNSPVGVYKNAITPQIIDNNSPPKLSNYVITKVVPGSITVEKALLTATADNQTRAYGAADPTFTVTLTGASAAAAADGITGFGTSTDTTASIPGSYLITPHLNDPNTRLSNYTVISRTGFLTITKAPLTVTADDQTRPVGQPNPTFTGVIVGALPADNITAMYSTTATMSSPAGTYPIVPMIITNPKISNYIVTTVNGTLTVQ